MADQLTVSEFAAKIKSQYPSVRNTPDDVLVGQYLQKHPQFKSKVRMDVPPPANPAVQSIVNRYGKSRMSETSEAATEYGLSGLPTAGATTGALLGEGWWSVPGAMLGGSSGKALEQILRRAIFGTGPRSSLEAAKAIGTEGAEQGALEAAGKVGGKVIEKAASKIPVSRMVGRIPMLTSERTGSRIAGMGEHFMERSIPSAGVMQRFRQQQTEAIVREAQNLASTISSATGTEEEKGRLIQKAIDDARKRISNEVSSAYQAVDQMSASRRIRQPYQQEVASSLVDEFGRPTTFNKTAYKPVLTGGAPVQPTNIRRAAGELLAEIYKQKKLLDPTEVEPLVKYLKSIRDSSAPVDFTAADKSRSALLAMTRKYEGILGTSRSRITSLLERGVDADMDEAAKAVPGLSDQLKVARSLSKEQHRLFDQKLIQTIIETNKPEAISGFIKSSGIQEIRDLYKLLDPSKRELVAAQTMQGILGDVLRAPSSSTVSALSPRSAAFRGDMFGRAIDELGDDKGQILFGKAWPSVQRFKDVVSRVKPDTAEWMALHNYVYLGAAISLPFHPLASAAVGGEAMVMRQMAKVMTNPKGIDAAAKYFSAVARHSPRAANLALEEFRAASRQAERDSAPSVQPPQVPQELRQ